MKTIISAGLGLVFLFAFAVAQTGVFDVGAVVTDSQLRVARNPTSSPSATLTSAMGPLDLSFQTAGGAAIPVNSLATICTLTTAGGVSTCSAVETVAVCNVSGTTVSVGYSSCSNIDGRGFDGSTAINHPAGSAVFINMDAWHHNALAKEVEKIETVLNGSNNGLFGSAQATAKTALNTYWLNPVLWNTLGVVNPNGSGGVGVPAIGFSSWFRQNNGNGNNGVAIMDACEAAVANSSCFGMNIVLGTNGNASGATNTNRVGIEIDNEGYYTPDSNSFAVSAIQYNVQNPSSAFIVRNGNHAVTAPAWGPAFYSEGGASATALFAGSQLVGTTPNSPSQKIVMQATDGSGAQTASEMHADSTGHLILNYKGIQSGTALQVQQINSCTTAASSLSTCNNTITWPAPFADTSYAPVCTIAATSGAPFVVNVQGGQTAAATTVQIGALTSSAAAGTLTCWGIHF
jgi:hypothetical protein